MLSVSVQTDFDKTVHIDYTDQKHSHPIPHPFMSEQLNSDHKDPVTEALELEAKIAKSVESPLADATARKAVRGHLESWMALMQDPKVVRSYEEALGELPVDVALQDILNQVSSRFSGVAKGFGWDPRAVQQNFDVAA